MAHDSPFGPKKAIPVGQDDDSERFAQLKPVCVELLSNVTANVDKGRDCFPLIAAALKKLNALLSGSAPPSPHRSPLSPSLINYVFFPLAQLLRAYPKGETELPDRVRYLVFQNLHHLATDWWQIWTDARPSSASVSGARVQEQWKVWEQLLILGAVALAGSPDGKAKAPEGNSDETQLAICVFLQEILFPRLSFPSSMGKQSPGQEWEWDGEEELPSLDEFDRLESSAKEEDGLGNHSEPVQVYPCSSHLRHAYEDRTCRGAIAHALTASLDVANAQASCPAVKVACLQIARALMAYWMAGCVPNVNQPVSLWRQVTMEAEAGKTHKEDSDRSGQADRVAVFLPGFVSSMVRILTTSETRKRADVSAQAVFSLAIVLEVSLCDGAIRDLATRSRTGSKSSNTTCQAASIEELVARASLDDDLVASPPATTQVDKSEHSPNDDSRSGRNQQWLESTVSHVIIALHSLDTLSSHDHAQVQVAMVNLASTLLLRCPLMLGVQKTALEQANQESQESIDATRLLLRWVVDVAAKDSGTELAVTQANDCLRRALCDDGPARKAVREAVDEETMGVMKEMPRLLASRKDEEVERVSKRLAFLLCLSSSGLDASIAVLDGVRGLLRPSSGVARWGPSLLWSLRIDDRSSVGPSLHPVVLQGLTPSSSRAVMAIFEELGRASARIAQQDCFDGAEMGEPFHLLWYFIDQATSHRSTLLSASSPVGHSRLFCQNALLVGCGMMQGVAEILDDGRLAVQTAKPAKKLRRLAHRLAKDVFRRVAEMWEEDEEELLQLGLSRRKVGLSSEEQRLLIQDRRDATAIEYTRGVKGVAGPSASAFERPAGFGPALKLDFVASATLTNGKGDQSSTSTSTLQLQREARAQMERTDALLLQLLSLASRILGPSLKPLLLQVLYPVICGVASQSTVVQEAAAEAMDGMARWAGYASVQGCVMDHADYVLGTASHRLVSTLGQELQAMSEREEGGVHVPLISAQAAPLVLVEVIRMLGGEALTLIQDAIDEVLDAIDRHHLQSGTCDDLLTVLDRLVDVMLSDEQLKAQERASERKSPSATLAFQPDVERDMEGLLQWWQNRKAQQRDGTNASIPPLADTEETGEGKAEDGPSASQTVVVSMLNKAVPFLSHSSARIRTRCLRLLNRGIELLCLQGRTVEPLQVISVAWPAIMSRLGFSLALSLRRFEGVDVPAYEELSEQNFQVCIEAAKLVTTLAKYLVDYLGSEKMIKQAVPRLLLLLSIVERAEGRGGEEKRSGPATFLLHDGGKAAPARTVVGPSRGESKWQPIQRHSPLYTICTSIITTLDTLVHSMGPHMTEADLYRLATHASLLQCLDRRQDAELQRRASHFYLSTLSKRNENLVWLVLSGALDQSTRFPLFFRQPQLQVEWQGHWVYE